MITDAGHACRGVIFPRGSREAILAVDTVCLIYLHMEEAISSMGQGVAGCILAADSRGPDEVRHGSRPL